jgi:hypothetical protein
MGIFHWYFLAGPLLKITYYSLLLDRSCRRIDLEAETKQTQKMSLNRVDVDNKETLPSTNWIESDDFPETKLRNKLIAWKK